MTYVILSAVVLALLVVACLPVLRRVALGPLVWTLVVLVVLTVVFDNVIVGLGIVGYDEDLIWGVRMPIAPVEDLAYAIGAVIVVPTLWILAGRIPGVRRSHQSPDPKRADA